MVSCRPYTIMKRLVQLVVVTCVAIVLVIVARGSLSSPRALHVAHLAPKAMWNLEEVLIDRFVDPPFSLICVNGNSEIETLKLIVILVTSAPHHFDRRKAIRETWADRSTDTKNANGNQRFIIHTLFLIGTSSSTLVSLLLDNEMKRFDDILFGHYVDTYRNLTLKVLHGFYYLNKTCGKTVNYVLKTDDDCFVNVQLLVHLLRDQQAAGNRGRDLYVGHIKRGSSVIRSSQSKWYVPTNLLTSDIYPDYASGIGYIVSGDLLHLLLEAATTLMPFPNEDAFVGLLCSMIKVRPLNSDRFFLHGASILRPCNFRYIIVVHRVIGFNEHKRLSAIANNVLFNDSQCHHNNVNDETWMTSLK